MFNYGKVYYSLSISNWINFTLVINKLFFPICCTMPCVATPLWQSVGVKPNIPKVGDLESSGTLECLEFDNKAQNTFHWGVLDVIEKVLKRRYPK